MSTKKREPLLSDDEVYAIVDKSQRMDDTEWDCACNATSEAIELYEAARAKDAALIQTLVDAIQLVADQGTWTPEMHEALDAANEAGFTPSI